VFGYLALETGPLDPETGRLGFVLLRHAADEAKFLNNCGAASNQRPDGNGCGVAS